ncbi:MAG: hypothetical protein V4598_01305 [Bdellovibrionota bacterium]
MSVRPSYSRSLLSTVLSLVLVSPSYAGQNNVQAQASAAETEFFVSSGVTTVGLRGGTSAYRVNPADLNDVTVTYQPMPQDRVDTSTVDMSRIVSASTGAGGATSGTVDISNWRSRTSSLTIGDATVNFNGFNISGSRNTGIYTIGRAAPGDLLNGLCDIDNFLPAGFGDLQRVGGRCIPPQNSFSTDFTNDLSICSCLDNDRTSLQGQEYQRAKTLNPSNWNSQTQSAMNDNVDRLNRVLEAEQNAMRFQASTLPASDSGSEFLSGAFSNYGVDVSSNLERIRADALRQYNELSDARAEGNVAMAAIEIRPPDENLLTSRPNTPEQCIPMRTHMTGRQMPTEPAFFEDMASLPETYDQNQWNYETLKARFLREAGPVRDLREALTKPEAKKTFLRLQFLERNPLYKNLFSSDAPGATAQKQILWNKIRTAYGNRSATPEQKTAAFLNLRRDTGRFFTSSSEIVSMTQAGATANMNLLMAQIPRRVRSISVPFDPATTWDLSVTRNRLVGPIGATTIDINDPALISTTSFMGVSVGANGLFGETRSRRSMDRERAGNYASYCSRLTFASWQNQYTVLKELEDKLGAAYSSEPWKNDEYANQNINMCTSQRRPRTGTGTSSFVDFRIAFCSAKQTAECDPANQPALVARYLNEYPLSASGDDDSLEISAIMPFLKGSEIIPTITPEAAARATVAGSSQAGRGGRGSRNRPGPRGSTTSRTAQQVNFDSQLASVNQEIAESGNTSRVAGGRVNNAPETTTAARTPVVTPVAATRDSQQQQQPTQPFAPILPSVSADTFVAPIAPVPPAVAARDNLRSQVRTTETESTAIRDELAGLRESFQRESAQPAASRDNDLVRDLNARLGSLEERLETKDREATDLRRQLARAERRVQEEVPAAARVPDSSDSVRRSAPVVSGGTTGSTGGTPQGSVQTGGAQGTPQLGGGSSVGGGAASLARTGGGTTAVAPGLRSGGGSSGNQALLSKYGVQSSSVQGGIVVANPSATINYQDLRTESADSIVAVPLSLADYNQIASSGNQDALRPYLDQCRALAGDVCRLNVSAEGGGNPIELFVVKNGNEISIVPSTGASRGLASGAQPEPVRPLERDRTLDGLRKELSQ